MKLNLSLLIAVIFLGGYMFSCAQKDNGNENSTTEEDINKYSGVYHVTDERDFKWDIQLNPDKTVVAQCDGKIHYGSWGTTRVLTKEKFNGPGMNFSFEELPSLYFPNGKKNLNSAIFGEDGYIYASAADYRARNPRNRLKYTR